MRATRYSARDVVRYTRAVEAYREIRREQERVAEMADAAFLRWFQKRQAGQKTNGGAAVRLANRENYLSAETYSAEAEVFAAGEALGIEDFDLDAIYLEKEEG